MQNQSQCVQNWIPGGGEPAGCGGNQLWSKGPKPGGLRPDKQRCGYPSAGKWLFYVGTVCDFGSATPASEKTPQYLTPEAPYY